MIPSMQNLKIQTLLIDKQPQKQNIQSILEKLGHTVTLTKTLQEGWKLLQTHLFHLDCG